MNMNEKKTERFIERRMHTLAVAGVATVAVVGVLVYARMMFNSPTPEAAVEAPAQAEVGTFVNDTYAVEAPLSSGTVTGTTGGTGMTGTIAEFAGGMLATPHPVLAAGALAGQVADFANTGVRRNTETLFKEAGLQSDLQAFLQRQDGYDMASSKIDEAMLASADVALQGAPPLIQDFGRGFVSGVGDLANAPVELAALADSAVSGQVAKFKGGDDIDKAMVIMGSTAAMTTGILFDGIGGGLADKIAKTPEERAKAQEVLNMMNPAKQAENVVRIAVPAIQASIKETEARLAKEKADRDAAAKALSDRLAAEQRARDAAAKALSDRLAAEREATADRLAAEHRAREERARQDRERMAREQRERNERARADAAKRADDLRKSNEKAKNDLKKAGDALKNAFTPKKRR